MITSCLSCGLTVDYYMALRTTPVESKQLGICACPAPAKIKTDCEPKLDERA